MIAARPKTIPPLPPQNQNMAQLSSAEVPVDSGEMGHRHAPECVARDVTRGELLQLRRGKLIRRQTDAVGSHTVASEIHLSQPIGHPKDFDHQAVGVWHPGCLLAVVGAVGHERADRDAQEIVHVSPHRLVESDRRSARIHRLIPAELSAEGVGTGPRQERRHRRRTVGADSKFRNADGQAAARLEGTVGRHHIGAGADQRDDEVESTEHCWLTVDACHIPGLPSALTGYIRVFTGPCPRTPLSLATRGSA